MSAEIVVFELNKTPFGDIKKVKDGDHPLPPAFCIDILIFPFIKFWLASFLKKTRGN
jgi:hypothetical protein